MGYYRAGFDVVGVDIHDQPHYPFPYWQQDAFAMDPLDIMPGHFDAIHASPPCQRYTIAQNSRKNADAHPDLVGATRDLLRATGLPYVIENVPGAPLLNPVTVCGSSFGMTRIRRHRLFETSFPVMALPCDHTIQHDVLSVAGHSEGGSHRGGTKRGNYWGADAKREAMGIDWMTREELREAIPPAYTEFLGSQLLEQL